MRIRSGNKSSTEAEGQSRWGFVRFLAGLAIFTWALRSLVIQPFDIPSGSMLPTLYIGDYLLVAKWPYGFSRFSFPFNLPSFPGRVFSRLPKRGDVVVFHHPTESEDLIKRVVGLPGDLIAVSRGQLLLNSKAVPRVKLPPVDILVTPNSPCRTVDASAQHEIIRGRRTFCVYAAYLETLPGGPSYTVLDQVEHGPGDDFGPVRVPPGHLFLLGDNRDDSLDSRFATIDGGVGMLPIDDLIGPAMVTFWSTDGSSSYLEPWTWFGALRFNRIGNGYTGDLR